MNKRYTITIVFSHIMSFLAADITALILFGVMPDDTLKSIAAPVAAAAVYMLLYLYFTKKYRRRRKIAARHIPGTWHAILEKEVYYYSRLSEAEKMRFLKQVQIFLGEKRITGVKTDVDETIRLLVAASAVIPVFNIPDWEYDRLDEVLVYPENFTEDFSTGENENVLGMVFSNSSSMIISKPAIIRSFANHKDSFNVGIHEFIHKLDGEDGEIDGIPALLLDHKTIRRFIEVTDNEIQKIISGNSDINPYGATSRVEFFAVAAEYYFENPGKMKERHPELHSLMRKIFRQNLISLFSDSIKSMIPRRRRGRRK